MKLLIAADDTRLVESLEAAIRDDGHDVLNCASREEARFAIERGKFLPDIVVLQERLGREDAVSFVPELRGAFPAAAVLVLCATDSAEARARTLDRGADDCLACPFSAVELRARLRALARRMHAEGSLAQHTFGDLHLDPVRHSALVGDRAVSLSHKEFLVLNLLLERPGKILRKVELLEKVWDSDRGAETNVLEATINKLRRKLEHARANVRIRNMRNVGYWLER